MPRRCIPQLAFLLLVWSCHASAWGERGHRLVGALAERELSPAARAQVQELLRDEPEASLAGVATWADAVREQPGWGWTAPLHYVHIKDRDCRYDAKRDCARGECVVGAIARYAATLADHAAPRAARVEALKFVVHFVADVHQPLHSGWRRDKGGNEFQVSLRRPGRRPEGTSLHGVWDHFIVAGHGEAFDAQLQRLAFAGVPSVPAGFEARRARRWAERSCGLSDGEGFYPPRPGRLPEGYLDAQRPLAERRLREAAAELAALLEHALGERD